MKKLLALILAVLMLLSMAACGTMAQPNADGEDDPAVTEPKDAEPKDAEPKDAEPDAENGSADAEKNAPGDAEPPAPDESKNAGTQQPAESQPAAVSADKATAAGYVGADVSALYAAVGRPASSDYAPSCLGSGEDGNLYYDGFTVYTYRENGSETVQYVE